MVELTIDGSQIKRLVKVVEKYETGIPQLVKPLVAYVLDRGKEYVRQAIKAQYLIQDSDIHMEVHATDTGGSIEIKGGMLRLTRFPHHPSASVGGKMPSAMFAQVKVGGGGVMPGGFMTGSGDGIFIRSGGAGRLPINKLLTIGAPIMASQPSVGPVANEAIGKDLDESMDRAIQSIMASEGG